MADPLSIAASLVGVAAAAIATSKLVFKVGETIAKARPQINDLAQGLASFHSVLTTLSKVIQGAPDILDDDGVRDARLLIGNCSTIVEEIQGAFARLDKDSLNIIDRAKWVFKKDSLQYPRARLEAAKSDLMLITEVLNLAISLSNARSSLDPGLRQQYESARIYVACSYLNDTELRAFEDGLNDERILSSTGTQAGDEDALVRLQDTQTCRPFQGLHQTPAPSLIHEFGLGNGGPQFPRSSREVMAYTTMEAYAAALVTQLLEHWTFIDDTTYLPSSSDSRPKDSPLENAPQGRAPTRVFSYEVEEVEDDDITAGLPSPEPQPSLSDSSASAPEVISNAHLERRMNEYPAGWKIRLLSYPESRFKNAVFPLFRWPKENSPQEKTFASLEMAMLDDCASWDVGYFQRQKVRMINLRLGLFDLTTNKELGEVGKDPCFVIPFAACQHWCSTAGPSRPMAEPGMSDLIQGACLFALDFFTHLYNRESNASDPDAIEMAEFTERTRKLYHDIKKNNYDVYRVSRAVRKSRKINTRRILRVALREDSIEEDGADLVPLITTKIPKQDWEKEMQREDMDAHGFFIDVHTRPGLLRWRS
ncbi:MAG: hypothetical protein M1819_006256 [Sarea resinae]|nr:MAG: hypothetical protein M1819_006256 [Sarea resinae]